MASNPGACPIMSREMDIPVKEKPVTDLRVYLAGERTFLAWIRTGIALMAFGLLVRVLGSLGTTPK